MQQNPSPPAHPAIKYLQCSLLILGVWKKISRKGSMCGHFFFNKDMELHYYPTIQMTKGGTDVQQTALWICTHAQDKHAEIEEV